MSEHKECKIIMLNLESTIDQLKQENEKLKSLIRLAIPELLAYCKLADCDFDDVHEWLEDARAILNK